jgi:hypothetical protein
MSTFAAESHSDGGIDRSLIEWFAGLTPEQRLAELESRVSFLERPANRTLFQIKISAPLKPAPL